MRPLIVMLVGLVFIVAGVALPLLIALGFFESGFALSFAAHLLSSAGSLLALYGMFRGLASNDRERRSV
jgi:hypothetical protein